MLTILILDYTDQAQWVDTLAYESLSACEDDRERYLRRVSLDELMNVICPTEDQLLWLFTPDDFDPTQLHRHVQEIVEQNVPVLISRENETRPLGDEYDAGAVIAPADSPPASLALMINTMAALAPVIKFRGHELRLTKQQTGGVRGEITRIDEEMRLAAEVQRQFMPRGFPPLDRMRFDAIFLPAHYVSGDIYDVFRMDEHHVGVFLADAMGHGTPAALMTVYVKRSLPTKEVEGKSYRLLEPHEAVTRLNNDLLAAGDQLNIVTAFYAIIDIRTLEMKYVLAGHPKPALMHGNGETSMLDADGPLIGVFKDQVYEQRSVMLKPKDRLLVFSDGFFDLFLNQEDLASCELGPEILRTAREGETPDAVMKLRDCISRQPGSLHQRDDITVLMMTVDEELSPDEEKFTHHMV